MGKIKLEALEFHAHHGMYPEAREKGNRFTVDVEVDYPFEKEAGKDDLDLTVNYEVLYDITRRIMEVPSNLLEHLAMSIARAIRQAFPDRRLSGGHRHRHSLVVGRLSSKWKPRASEPS